MLLSFSDVSGFHAAVFFCNVSWLPTLLSLCVQVGDIGYISDTAGLHSIRCCDADPGQADGITLHLYSPPIRRVTLYEPDEGVGGRVVQRAPGFYTVRGVKQ